ncbi:hypothetical protein DRQ50_03300 [bacterium]|nr:MAG: hypothetical protein DRQ50_03300 [bacterium]
MKLAICSQGELFGGVERHILDLIRYVQRSGLPRPTVLLFHDLELADRLRESGTEPVILRGRHRYDRDLVLQARSRLDGDRVEVVHAHGYKATVVCALARGDSDWKLVKTEHGKLEATLSSPVDWAKSRLNFALEQWLTRRQVDHVCYVTDDIAGFYGHRHRGLARTTVPNGIDPVDRNTCRRPEELVAGHFNVGVVGRVTAVKGIDLAIAALGRPEVPPQVTLHVIGTGPLESDLRRQADAAGLAGRVRFHGFRRDIFDFLAHLDTLLMPSHHEGLPYTLLEAWSLGCPVIASRVGGLAEALNGQRGAQLVAAGDVEGIAAALARQVGMSVDEARPGPCPYTLEAMGSAYLEIFACLAGKAIPDGATAAERTS